MLTCIITYIITIIIIIIIIISSSSSSMNIIIMCVYIYIYIYTLELLEQPSHALDGPVVALVVRAAHVEPRVQ